MPALTPTPPRPASRGVADGRLPWWALALPALLFTTLLALVLRPSEAHAAAGDPAVGSLLTHLSHLVTR